MGKISTGILQGTRQRDNSVNSTSSNTSQTQSDVDNENTGRLHIVVLKHFCNTRT